MELKAQAYKAYGNAAKMKLIIDALPKIAAEAKFEFFIYIFSTFFTLFMICNFVFEMSLKVF